MMCLTLCFIALQGILAAHSYYVSLTGNDLNPGSFKKPWRTIQHAADFAKPGSTVYVREGVYFEKVIIRVEGTPCKGYITFRNYPKEHAIISGEGVPPPDPEASGDNIIYIEDKNFIKIIGFEIRDLTVVDGSGIRLFGGNSHIQLLNNTIHNIRGGGEEGGAMGITIYGSDDNKSINNLIIAGNEIYDCDPAFSEALTLNGNVEKFLVENNIVHDVNNIGIDFIGGETWLSNKRTRNGICRGNTVYRARSSYGGGFAAGIYVDGGYNIVLSKNEVYECDLGIEVGAENPGIIASHVTVDGNYVHHNDKVGIVFGGYDVSVGRVKYCTFSHNVLTENDTLNTGNGEFWIQYASNNAIKFNTITPTAQMIVVNSDLGSVDNTMNFDTYRLSQVNDLIFIWEGDTYVGLSDFQFNTGQEVDAIIVP